MIDFNPIHLDINNKYRNLDVSAKGVVKGTKYFPVFLIDDEEYIFKPISKTKPYATPLFCYAEVYWSYVINRFFDNSVPICRLPYCHGLSQEQKKYYDKGILVKSTIKSNQKLINLLDIYDRYPDAKVDIKDYVNYCMEFYSYTDILDSDFIKNNPSLGGDLAFQILLAILRHDYNYHYENVNFIEENGRIVGINPPIDFEFSSMFIYPDDSILERQYYNNYRWQLRLRSKRHFEIARSLNLEDSIRSKSLENIGKIVLLYPEIVERFLICLDDFLQNVNDINLSDDNDFIGLVDSNAWEIGHYTFKEDNPLMLQNAYGKVCFQRIDTEQVFLRIKEQVKESAEELRDLLNTYIFVTNKGVSDLVNFTLEDLLKLKLQDEELKRSLEKKD